MQAGLGYVLLQSMAELEQQFENVKTPYFLILGAEDKITYVEGSKEFHKKSGSDDKTYKEVKDGFHHLFIEKEAIRNQTVTDIWDWIVKRL